MTRRTRRAVAFWRDLLDTSPWLDPATVAEIEAHIAQMEQPRPSLWRTWWRTVSPVLLAGMVTGLLGFLVTALGGGEVGAGMVLAGAVFVLLGARADRVRANNKMRGTP